MARLRRHVSSAGARPDRWRPARLGPRRAARTVAHASRAALVALPRRRARRLPARARDLPPPARLARPGDGARLAEGRREARGAGGPPRPRRAVAGRRRRFRRPCRRPPAARSTTCSPAASASRAPPRRCAHQARRGAGAMLKAQGPLLRRDRASRSDWTYTKVNRCITEGRARFLKVYAEIEAGEACERYGPTLAALVGGTATADALLELRPHIRNCAACRATVRDLHATRLGRLAASGRSRRWSAGHGPRRDPGHGPRAVQRRSRRRARSDGRPGPLRGDLAHRRVPPPGPLDDPSRWLELKTHVYGWIQRLHGTESSPPPRSRPDRAAAAASRRSARSSRSASAASAPGRSACHGPCSRTRCPARPLRITRGRRRARSGPRHRPCPAASQSARSPRRPRLPPRSRRAEGHPENPAEARFRGVARRPLGTQLA